MLTIDEKIKHLQNLGFDGDLKRCIKVKVLMLMI